MALSTDGVPSVYWPAKQMGPIVPQPMRDVIGRREIAAAQHARIIAEDIVANHALLCRRRIWQADAAGAESGRCDEHAVYKIAS
jgi:hypothetical protein